MDWLEKVKNNLPGFLGAFLILGGWAGYNLFQTIKCVEREKKIDAEYYQKKEELINVKHEIDIMKKDFELSTSNTFQQHTDDINKQYNQMNDLMFEAKQKIDQLEVKNSSLETEIQQKNSQIQILTQEKNEITKKINKFDNVQLITKEIKLYIEKYGDIHSGNRTRDYNRYIKAIAEYKTIQSLLNTYELEDDFSSFINNQRRILFQ